MNTGAPSLLYRRLTLAVLGLGIALRVYWNNAAVFSLGDEATYLRYGRELSWRLFARFPSFAAEFLPDPERWSQPSPLRWAHWTLLADVCAMPGGCTSHTLTTLSTLGGVAALVFTWLLGREWLGEKATLVAVALNAVSPLQLHLGRRALGDELVCALILGALWAASRAFAISRQGLRWHGLAMVLCALALAEKETTLLWAPAFFALWALRQRARGARREDLLLLLAPILSLLGFCILSGSATLFFRDAAASAGSLSRQIYAVQSHSGPMQTYLLDFFALAPLPFLAGIAAWGASLLVDSPDARGLRELRWIFFLAIVAFAFNLKNIRYLAAADSLLCLLAGWFLATATARLRRGDLWLAGLVCFVAATQLRTFQHLFLDLDVYDTTTVNLLKALDALPR
jgi:hypothetical protein